MISTDKVLNPTNDMCSSKRESEMVVGALAQQHAGTRFMAVASATCWAPSAA